MSSNPAKNDNATDPLHGVLNSALSAGEDLPDFLNFGVIALVLIVALAAGYTFNSMALPWPLLVLVAVVILAVLAAFAWSRSRDSRLSSNKIRDLINSTLHRKTFELPLNECAEGGRRARYAGTSEAYFLLKNLQELLDTQDAPELKQNLRELVTELDHYRDAYSPLVTQIDCGEYPNYEFPTGVEERLEEHRSKSNVSENRSTRWNESGYESPNFSAKVNTHK